MLKAKILTERVTVPVQPELKRELSALKETHNVDVTKWIRNLIIENLPKLKSEVAS